MEQKGKKQQKKNIAFREICDYEKVNNKKKAACNYACTDFPFYTILCILSVVFI